MSVALDEKPAADYTSARQLNHLRHEVAVGESSWPGKSVKCRCGRATVTGTASPMPRLPRGTTTSSIGGKVGRRASGNL